MFFFKVGTVEWYRLREEREKCHWLRCHASLNSPYYCESPDFGAVLKPAVTERVWGRQERLTLIIISDSTIYGITFVC